MCATLLGIGAAGQASAESAMSQAPPGYRLLDESVYTIHDGKISGELPPGTTLDTLKGDPNDPAQQEAIDDAEPVNLRLADGKLNGTGPAAPGTVTTQASYNDGCVTLFVDQVPGTGFAFSGNMVGCRRGNLYLHTYVRKGSVGAVIHNGLENECANSTSCSVTTSYYTGGEPVITFAAHGVNRSTGGDSTAVAAYGRVG